MKVACRSAEEFIKNLQDAAEVMDQLVFCSIGSVQDGGSINPHAIHVGCSLSAVISYSHTSGGWVLLSADESCGTDLLTADGTTEGSDRAEEITRMLKSVCDGRGLKIMPGTVSLS